jgi:hypothetical protein
VVVVMVVVVVVREPVYEETRESGRYDGNGRSSLLIFRRLKLAYLYAYARLLPTRKPDVNEDEFY